MTDSEGLRDLIAKRGLKLKYVAEAVHLSQYGLQLKINNKNEFKTSEVAVLCELLNIKSLEEKEKIFFANHDDLKSTKKKANSAVTELALKRDYSTNGEFSSTSI